MDLDERVFEELPETEEMIMDQRTMMDSGLKGGQGRTVVEVRHNGFSFGLCMALGVILGAASMWVGVQGKETTVQVSPQISVPEVKVPQAKVEVVNHKTPEVVVQPNFTVQMPAPKQQEIKLPDNMPVRVTNWPKHNPSVEVANWPKWFSSSINRMDEELYRKVLEDTVRHPDGKLLPNPKE